MLIKKESILYDKKKYRDIFSHKLTNVAKKSPALIQFIIYDDYVLVKESVTGLEKKFYFKFDKDVKESIYDIVEWLKEETYPILVKEDKVEKKLTKEEINNFVINGRHEELDDMILKGRYITKKTEYRIDRIIIGKHTDGTPRDELFLTNLSTGITCQYSLSIPVTIFLKQVRERFTPATAYEKFIQHSSFIKEC